MPSRNHETLGGGVGIIRTIYHCQPMRVLSITAYDIAISNRGQSIEVVRFRANEFPRLASDFGRRFGVPPISNWLARGYTESVDFAVRIQRLEPVKVFGEKPQTRIRHGIITPRRNPSILIRIKRTRPQYYGSLKFRSTSPARRSPILRPRPSTRGAAPAG